MDASQKEGPQRSRRTRSVPPADVAEIAALAARVPHEDVPRFLGTAAPLSVLAAELRQARSDHDSARLAALSVRLSRQLLRRGIELREAIGLLEKAFEVAPDAAVAQELGEAWAGVGDYVRGTSYLTQAAEGQTSTERARLFCQAALYFAHAGKVPQALQALRQAMTSSPLDPTAHELLGAMGFWADFPASDASRAYLQAARLHTQKGDENLALEALLRAFEIDPAERSVADALASALRDRRRGGAADEIIREHLRRGSAAARAAHYERTFHSVLGAQKWALALEAALEAELDVELDLDVLDAALDEIERGPAPDRAAAPPRTFEGFLVTLARYGWPGQGLSGEGLSAQGLSAQGLSGQGSSGQGSSGQGSSAQGSFAHASDGQDATKSAARFAEWLSVLVGLHVCNWGETEVLRMLRRLETVLKASPASPGVSADGLHELRSRLARPDTAEQTLALRSQIAISEGSRANWHEAYEVLEPVLDGGAGSRDFRALAILLLAAGRARQSAGRAQALAHLARFLPDEPAAVASAVAAETLLSESMVHAAADAARYAVEADPASPRAVAAQALVALTHPDRSTPGMIESSTSVLVARGAACQLLAQSAAQSGAPYLALSWAERNVALRPADPAAVREALERAAQAGDATRLLDRIEHLFGQPLPMVEIASDVAQALRRLLELSHDDAERAARLVLTKAGIRSPDCREVLSEVARVIGRPRLAADLLERLLVLAPSAQRGEMLLELAELRQQSGDAVAAARALRRALSSGASRPRVQAALSGLTGQLEPDAELSKLEAELELMPDVASPPEAAGAAAAEPSAGDAGSGQSSAEPTPLADKAKLLRRLGVMRFDLAQDTQGAIAAWMRAADLDQEFGVERIAHYLTVVAGADEAPVLLEKAASHTDDPTRKARLLGLAARAMLDVRRLADALRLATEALDKAPLQTEFLTVAERAATQDDLGRLDELYGRVADAALGRYGERAIHYRAARLLEKRGQPSAALVHAGKAFAAVPAEGAAFVLMARLSDVSSDPTPAIQAIEQVAAATKNEAERSRWLDKAASLASMAAGGSRQRVEILLRAAHLRAEHATVAQLEAALLDLEVLDKTEQKALERRVQALGSEALLHSSGAHGALLCVALARLYLRAFDDLEFGAACLTKAVALDTEIPEYEKLRESAARLAEREGLLEQLDGGVRSARSERGQLLGRGLAELLCAISLVRDKGSLGAELMTLAATDAPEDLELVGLARQAAEAAGRVDLLGAIGELLPPEERARLLLSRLTKLPEAEALQALLDLELGALKPELELRVLLALGSRLLAAQRYADGVDVFRQAVALSPEDAVALQGLEVAADHVGDQDELARVLKLRVDLAEDPQDKRQLQLRRARLLDRELSRIGEARALLEGLLASGEDAEVLDLLAQSLDASGDAERAAELWLRARAVAPVGPEANELTRRAARAYADAGLDRAAIDLLLPLQFDPDLCRMVLPIARRCADRKTELRALSMLAPLESPDVRDEAFLSAARIALGLGDSQQAEELSRKAADGSSDDALQAKILTWQLHVARAPSLDAVSAQKLLAELGPLASVAGASQREIHAYLLGVATLAVQGQAAARELLLAAIDEQGQRPLLAAALADLLAPGGAGEADQHQALSLYEAAIGGDLHGLRREGELLLEAGRLARLLGDAPRARGFASAIGDDDPCRVEASRLLEEMAAEEARALRLERERRQAEEEQAARAEEEAARAAQEQATRAAEEAARAMAAEAARALEEQAARASEETARAAQEQAARVAEEAARIAAAEAARALEEQAARAAEEAARVARELATQAAAAEAEAARSAQEQAARAEENRRRTLEAQQSVDRLLTSPSKRDSLVPKRDSILPEDPAKGALGRSPNELQASVARELREAEAAARRREVGARERRLEREKKEDEAARKEQAEAARQAARRADDEARRRLRDERTVEALGPRPATLTIAAAEPRSGEAAPVAASALRQGDEQSPEPLLAPDDQRAATATSNPTAPAFGTQARTAREEALKLAREEAARERALAPAADQKRGSTLPPPRRSSRPPGAQSLPPMARRASERPGAPAPAVELDFPPDETSVVQVTLGELREVDELTPAEEAMAVHPADWGSSPEADAAPTGRSDRVDATGSAEDELVSRLEAGDVDAGVELLDRLQADRSRARDAVAVAGHLVLLRPGDGSLLGRLVASASRDGNEALALAVRHVLGSFGAGDQVAAPPLDRVADLPERTQAVLFRGLRGAGVEALTLVWEHASPVLRRELGTYGLTGGDRVPPTAPTPLAELYRDAARVLGMIRTPLFRVGTGDDISMRVLLLAPPAVLVSGRVDQLSTELAFHFGAALGAAMPEHALLYGLEPEALANLLAGLTLSFGGDARATAGSGQTQAVRLASLLWEAIPPRAQRRLSSLCVEKQQLSVEVCLGYSTLVLRRAGLLVSGDVRIAVIDACESAGIAPPRSLTELALAARAAPAVADLLQLAVSPEYAELRFRAGRSG